MAAQTTAWVNFNGKDVGVKISIEGIEKSLNKMQRNGKKDIDSLSASFKNLKSQISSMSGSMGSLPLIGGLGAAGIFAGGKTAVEKFSGRETLETAITFFSKTEDVAKSNLSFLKNTSNSLGIVYDVAADGYKRLLANMSLMNIPMEEQNSKFLKISSAIRAMGLDAGQSESVFRAFGDMMAKGSIQAQELKTQLANAMPGTMGYMAKAVGGDAAKVAKMLDAGAITWAKYGDKLIDIMYNSTKDGLDKAVLTTSAGLARIQNTWDSTMVGIGDAIVRSGALDVISQMGKELEVWVSANKEMIASSVKGGVDFVKKGFEWAVANKEDIGSVVKGIGIMIAAVQGANLMLMFTNPIVLAAAAMAGLVVSIDLAMGKLEKAKADQAKADKKNTGATVPLTGAANIWAGLGNVATGSKNLLKGLSKGENEPILSPLASGLSQILAGTAQSFIYGSIKMRGGNLDETLDYKKSRGQNWYESLGKYGMQREQSLYYESSPNSIYETLSEKYQEIRPLKERLNDGENTASQQSIIDAILKGFQLGMSGVTINIDNGGLATATFGATKGPVIESIKN